MDAPPRERWGLILAGGEGVRLRPLTRVIAGDERPKQFCALLGRETLLEQTRRRVARVIPPARILVVLTRHHERFYRPLLAGLPPRCAIVQPDGRGTAVAILYGLLRLATIAPEGSVAIVPSDHYVSDDTLFMSHVVDAFSAVRTRPELVVLLGIAPESAETDYGWIEPGGPIAGTPLLRVDRFVEKPSPAVALGLFERGCLWNSFVMVARVPALLATIRAAMPDLFAAFEGVVATLGTSLEDAAIRMLYERASPVSFSDRVLAARPASLAVLAVRGVRWTDLGAPARVLAIFDRLGIAHSTSSRSRSASSTSM